MLWSCCVLPVLSLMTGTVHLMIELSIWHIRAACTLSHEFLEILEICSIDVARAHLALGTYACSHSYNLSDKSTSTHNASGSESDVSH